MHRTIRTAVQTVVTAGALTAGLVLMASPAFAGGGGGKGNSSPATACKTGGYLDYVGTSGAFATQSDCVSYAVGGGTLYPVQPVITAANAAGTFGGNNVYFLHIDGPANPGTTAGISNTWVPNQYTTVTVDEYWSATPTTYTFTKDSVPSSYQSQFNTGSTGVLANDGTLYESCIDPNGIRRTDDISYDVTVSDGVGQTSNKASGSFACGSLESPQMTITSDGLYSSTMVNLSFSGSYFQPNENLTMSRIDEYSGAAETVDTTGYPLGTTDVSGSITIPDGAWADDCGAGTLTTDQPIIITFTGDKGDSVTAAGTLDCSALAS